MLKTLGSTESIANPKKTKSKADGNNMADNCMVDNGEVTNLKSSTKPKNQVKITKSKNHDFPRNSKNMKSRSGFLISETKLAFTQLRQTIVEALIFHDLNSKYYI